MSYMDIDNLYKNKDILLFKECYALEKIHGTSAHISWKYFPDSGAKQLIYFSGGEKHANFINLFDNEFLMKKFEEIFPTTSVIIYGEAYGGKCQGMSATYGKVLKFVAFEVKIEEYWVSVPQAEEICKQFNIEFVHYDLIATDIEIIEKLCNAPSIQAIRNGMGEQHLREGIVLRPLIEVKKNNGDRIIAKHKNNSFKEREHQPKLTQDRLEVMEGANKIADEWVTPMRLAHILDNFPNPKIEDTGNVCKAMFDDILKESKGEIEISNNKELKKMVSKKTAFLYKQTLERR